MLRKGLVLGALSLFLTLGTQAKAQVNNPYELTLGGSASNGPDFNGFNAAANIGLGYYFTETLEVGVRQSVTYTDLTGGDEGSQLNASTRVFLDLHFPLGDEGRIVPFVGANIGFVYGDSVQDSFLAGPEAGLKLYFSDTAFVFVAAEYQFFFDQNDDTGDALGDSFSDGQFIYTLGIGLRF